jgi:hypothetical protein
MGMCPSISLWNPPMRTLREPQGWHAGTLVRKSGMLCAEFKAFSLFQHPARSMPTRALAA